MKKNIKSQSVSVNILLAHGSKDPKWRKLFEDLLDKSIKISPKKIFLLCYLELCGPSLSEIVKDLVESNYKISIINIFPIFLSAGVHVNEDIQTIVTDLKEVYPHLKFKINDVVGKNSIVSNAILKVVTS